MVRSEGAATSVDCGDYTLGRWLEHWLRLCNVRALRPTTVEHYKNILGLYVPPDLLSADLSDVRPQHLSSVYEQMLAGGRRYGQGGLSSRTVRLLHVILHKAFADAVRLGILEWNPAHAADAPSRRACRPRVYPTWSPAELRKFLDSVRDDEFYAAFYLAAATGLRRGEVVALRWCDLDLNRDDGQLHVVQTVVLLRGKVQIGVPKTDRGRRVVALDKKTVEVLHRHRRHAERQRQLAGKTKLDERDFVFIDPAGGPLRPTRLSSRFERRLQAAGLRKIRFHDLRHTHATHALQVGVHPKIVSERLGHSSIAITLDTYSHAMPSMQREAAEAVAALLADATL